ncbi:MAG TPA: patatin-like phospholipase family protein [Acidobacteriaceae bacterium]|jgi:hypothetical protein
MNEDSAKDGSQLGHSGTPGSGSDGEQAWTILRQLSKEAEPRLRQILRPHEEAGITWELDADTIALRLRLDKALNQLTLLELRYQTGQCAPDTASSSYTSGMDVVPIPAGESLQILVHSEAFLHYCSSYLYFGVRFLAERLYSAEKASQERLEQSPKSGISESHWRPFALATPPCVITEPQTVDRFLNLQSDDRRPEEEAALLFLDGYFERPLDYELWLRGLLSTNDAEQNERFRKVTDGLVLWLESRIHFYVSLIAGNVQKARPGSSNLVVMSNLIGSGKLAELGKAFSPEQILRSHLEDKNPVEILPDLARPTGGWMITDQRAARFGLADFYWIARLLRATVSSSGSVIYAGTSWMHLLRFHANLKGDATRASEIFQWEEVIRSVFDFCCDLIQNAIEVTGETVCSILAPDSVPTPPNVTRKWRFVFDEELAEIALQRDRRSYRDTVQPASPPLPAGTAIPLGATAAGPPPAARPCDREGWSERIATGKSPSNLVGLAFSGGGIRSATFNLGVLQGLQEFDLLRNIDYLSTVSGGGFIGSWLIGNVRRSAHWLGRVTDWSPSIDHLRNYSNYLAPRNGILSLDTWTMFASWIRNTFLIQLTGLVWLFVLLLLALIVKSGFVGLSSWPCPVSSAALLASICGAIVTATTVYNLFGSSVTTGKKGRASKWVIRLAVVPAWIGAFSIAALLWHDAPPLPDVRYSRILLSGWQLDRGGPLLLFTLVGLLILAALSLNKEVGSWRLYNAAWISIVCTFVLYLGLAGVFYLDCLMAADPESAWYAYVFSPALVLAAYSVSTVLFIGFTGRRSNEAIREWWTRFGASLGISGAAAIAIPAASIFSPRLTYFFWNLSQHHTIAWASVLSWLGTVIGGLFAGKSSKTGGERNKSPNLEILAIAGGLLFIVGALLLASTLLYFLLFKIFGPEKAKYCEFLTTLDLLPAYSIPLALIATAIAGYFFSQFFEINIFGLNQFYRNRIVRCYLGASRTTPGVRKPNPFTGFDFQDDIKLHKLQKDDELDQANGPYRGPFPIINCALNLAGSQDLAVKTRHSASFSLTPFRCGSDRPLVGYAPTLAPDGMFANGIMLGQAVSVSGAAISPNQGYNTSPIVAFLLTMFNLRLGWWFPNPGQSDWNKAGLGSSFYYLSRELFGLADEARNFLNVSDGGHFENLAVYELIRRRCKVIILCDAECDEKLEFGGLGNLIRICETDFDAIIDLDVKSIRLQKGSFSLAHCAIGQIKYSNGSIGYLIYVKASITGDEPVSVAQYRSAHPTFPHETTADQFFSDDQFESYRKLGQHVVEHSLRGTIPGQHPVAIAEKLADVLTPAGCPSEVFLKHSAALNSIWDRCRQSSHLHPFLRELMGLAFAPVSAPENPVDLATRQSEELCLGLQLIALMEDVFLDLRLEDFWQHPDNRGWVILFMQWSRSSRFRQIWTQTHRTFGIRFEHFCTARLGLHRDRPIVRV